MKSAETYCDELAKVLYMGSVPDLWNLTAKKAIISALEAYADERLEEAALDIEATPGNTYTTDCDHEQLAASIRALKSSGKGEME